jgi:ABC-type transport system substrate-binding protein
MKPAIETLAAELEKDVPGIQLDWHSSGSFGVVFKNTPPFNDPKVREAIDLFIDRKAILQIGYPRGGVYDIGVLSQEREGIWGLPFEEIANRPGYRLVDSTGKVVTTIQEVQAKWAELRKDPRDQERAKQLLADAGIKPGSLKFEVLVVSFEVPRGGPPFVAQMKDLFGATWTMKPYGAGTGDTQAVNEGRFSLYWNALGSTLFDPSLTLEGYTNTGGLSRVATAAWPDTDPFIVKLKELFDRQDATLDPAERRDILWEFQRTILDWRGVINSNSAEGPAAYWPEVRNTPDIVSIREEQRLDRIWLAR